MAKEKHIDCVELKKSEEDIGYRKTKKGKGAYDTKKDDTSYPGKHRTHEGRYGSVKFD